MNKNTFAAMFTQEDHQYMQRCLQLASYGEGRVAPNPLVGAVIVHNNKIIGEGWHQKFGGPHAEVNAVNSVANKTLLTASKIYVSLEPCNHTGKTPPCTDLILKYNISEVIVAMKDPSPVVNGAGMRKLIEAGVNVKTGLLESEARYQNKRFVTAHGEHRPYITLKWAESSDGFIGRENETVRISNTFSSILTHRWRAQEQGIVTGGKTVATDNPMLTVRESPGQSPVRIIIDTKGGLNPKSNVFDGSVRTIVFSTNAHAYPNCELFPVDEGTDMINRICTALFNSGIHSVLVEGGQKTLQQFIDGGLWDETRIFKSHSPLNTGIPSPRLALTPSFTEQVGDNLLLHYFRSPL